MKIIQYSSVVAGYQPGAVDPVLLLQGINRVLLTQVLLLQGINRVLLTQ